jgi:thiol-disulfide isomerase/thioredoxin
MSPDDLLYIYYKAASLQDWARVHELAEDALDRLCSLTIESFAAPGIDEKLGRALMLLARAEHGSPDALPYAAIATLLAPTADSLLLAAQLHEAAGDQTAAWVAYALAERYGATTARDLLRTYHGAADFDVPTAAVALAWNPTPKAVAASKKLQKPPRMTEAVPHYSFETAEGPVTTESLKGKVVVLAFFASWCGPCKEELPELDAMAKRLAASKVAAKVIAVSVDQSQWDYGRFVQSSGLTGLTFAWSPDAAMDFRIRGIPALWLHDQNGVARLNTVGYGRGGVDRLEAEIRSLAP